MRLSPFEHIATAVFSSGSHVKSETYPSMPPQMPEAYCIVGTYVEQAAPELPADFTHPFRYVLPQPAGKDGFGEDGEV